MPQLVLTGHTGQIYAVAVDEHGKIYSCSNDRTGRIWAADGELLFVMTGHNLALSDVVIDSTDGTIYTSSRDQTIRMWSADGDVVKEKHVLQGHRSEIYALALDTALGVLYSGGRDMQINVWQVTNTHGSLPVLVRKLDGHTGIVTALVVGPDSTLFSCGRDRSAFQSYCLSAPAENCQSSSRDP